MPDLVVLIGQLAVDAPTGDVDWEEERISPERFQENRASLVAAGRTIYETVAIAPDGTVAAQSTISVPPPGASTPRSGARSCTATTAAAGSGWPSRPPTSGPCRTPTRRLRARRHPERRDQPVDDRDQRADRLRAGRGRRRLRTPL